MTRSVHRVPDPQGMRQLGAQVADGCRAGDVVVLVGPLGAGKTTFTQGLAEGLGVTGPVTSPTFVIAREHEPSGTGPSLVHVDAYRLSGLAELDDLDLDASLEESVTVVEWGGGLVDQLDAPLVTVAIDRDVDTSDDYGDVEAQPRVVVVDWPEGRP